MSLNALNNKEASTPDKDIDIEKYFFLRNKKKRHIRQFSVGNTFLFVDCNELNGSNWHDTKRV
jgi:hypothetical protein